MRPDERSHFAAASQEIENGGFGSVTAGCHKAESYSLQ